MYTFNPKQVKDQVVQWIRDWFEVNGKGCNAVIGISGGKDSSVVAGLCVEALGVDRVIGVTMPNGVQPDIDDSMKLINHLGIRHCCVNIGDTYNTLIAAVGEQLGTLFISRENRLQFRKRWLAFGSRIEGSLMVDAGCAKAIRRPGGSSILPAGIKEVSGKFEAGHTVSVKDENGNELARGLSHYSSQELAKIKGHKSSEIESILGEKTYDEVIHRDDLVIL